MADHTNADPKSPVSPKVWAGLLTGLAVAAIGGLVTAVTPDTFDFLGPWGVIVYTGVTVGLAQLAAWLKRDPIRAVGAQVVVADPAAIDKVKNPEVLPITTAAE